MDGSQFHWKKKRLFPEFIEATRDFLNVGAKENSQTVGGRRENLGNWLAGGARRELYSLDLHHRGTIVLRNELEMVPRRLALTLEFRDVRRQLVEIDFRGSRNGADLKAESRRRCRESCSQLSWWKNKAIDLA